MLFRKKNNIKTGIKWFDGLEDSIGLTEQAWMEECVSTTDLLRIYGITKNMNKTNDNTSKKKQKIYGIPIYPIEVGNAAMISEKDGIRHTSEVLRLTVVSKRRIRFETRNTRYCLHLTGEPVSKEADAI